MKAFLYVFGGVVFFLLFFALAVFEINHPCVGIFEGFKHPKELFTFKESNTICHKFSEVKND